MKERKKSNLLEETNICSRLDYSLRVNNPRLLWPWTSRLFGLYKNWWTYHKELLVTSYAFKHQKIHTWLWAVSDY